MNIDPNIYIGSAIAIISALIGYCMGIARPYLDKRMLKTNRPATTASLPAVQRPTTP